MTSVARIEALIQKLSVADQRVVARHLDERLADRESSATFAAPDEGIRFLPQYENVSRPLPSHGRKLRQKAETAR